MQSGLAGAPLPLSILSPTLPYHYPLLRNEWFGHLQTQGSWMWMWCEGVSSTRRSHLDAEVWRELGRMACPTQVLPVGFLRL